MGKVFGFANKGGGMGFGRGKHALADTTTATVTTSVSSIAGEPGDVVTFDAGAENAAGQFISGKTYSAVSSDPAKVRVDSVVGRTVTCSILDATAGVNITCTCDAINAAPVVVSSTWIVASIALAPSSVSLDKGQTTNLTATAKNKHALVMPIPALTGATTNALIATVGAISGATVPVGGVSSGAATITVSSGGVTSNGASISVSASGASVPTPTRYAVTADASSVAAGGTVTVRAQLLDQSGLPIALGGQQVTWSKTGNGGSFASATSFTDATGLATIVFTVATDATVTHTVTATDLSLRTGTSGAITVTAAAAHHYSVGVSALSATVNATISVQAQLRDQYNNPVALAGQVVTWSSTNGGTFAAPTSTTAANGIATVNFTVAAAPTTHVVTATDAAARTGSSAAVSVVASSDFSGPAELPRLVPDTRWTTPTIDGLQIAATDASELQAGLDTIASTGDPNLTHAVVVTPGVLTYVANYVLPVLGAGTGLVHVTTSAKLLGTFALTPSAYVRGVVETQGQRVNKSHSYATAGASSPLAQLQTATLLPVIRCKAGASRYRFEAIEFSRAAGNTATIEDALVDTHNKWDAINDLEACTSVAEVPNDIMFGHCILRGDPAQNTRRGLTTGTNVGIRDSAIYDIRESGFESAAIATWNAPGGIAAINCFLQAEAQSLLTGGSGPTIPNMPVNDVTVVWCHSSKNPSGTFSKNHFESKNGGRWYIKNTIMEHNRPLGQDGTNILFQTLNDNNISPPQQNIADLTIENVLIIGGGPGLALLGRVGYDNGSGIVWPLLPTRRVHIKNVYGRDICGTLAEASGADGWLMELFNGVEDLLVEHVTGEAVGVGIIFNRTTIEGVDTFGVKNLEIRDCLLGKGAYGSLWADGGYDGNAALTQGVTGTVNVHNNVFYAPDGIPDNPAAYPANNFYVPKNNVGFAAWVKQNPGALAAGSPYHNAATDGGDIGADVPAILAMETAVRETVLPW